MMGVFAREQGFRFRNVEIGSCPPIDGDPAEFVNAKRLADCRDSLNLVRPVVDGYPVVMMSASYTAYQSHSDRFLDAFLDTARGLADRGKLVLVLGKAPVIPTYDRLCWEKALSFPGMDCEVANVPLAPDVAGANARLAAFAAVTPNVEYYEVTRYLCPGGECSAFDRNHDRIYYDSGHLTLDASWALGQRILAEDGVPAPIALVTDWSSDGQLTRRSIDVPAPQSDGLP
jgi:hypothetical protein